MLDLQRELTKLSRHGQVNASNTVMRRVSGAGLHSGGIVLGVDRVAYLESLRLTVLLNTCLMQVIITIKIYKRNKIIVCPMTYVQIQWENTISLQVYVCLFCVQHQTHLTYVVVSCATKDHSFCTSDD